MLRRASSKDIVTVQGTGEVLLVHYGSFGQAISEELTRTGMPMREVALEDLRSGQDVRSARCLALAVGNTGFAPMDSLDLLGRENGLRVVCLTMEHAAVVLTHFDPATAAACAVCYGARRLQHAAAREAELALRSFYEQQPDEGPAGYLWPVVVLGAQWLRDACLRNGMELSAGFVRSCSFSTALVATELILPVDGCPRCQTSHQRTANLRAEVREVWELWAGGTQETTPR